VKFDLQSIIGIERGSFSEKLNNKKEKEISRFFFSVVKVCTTLGAVLVVIVWWLDLQQPM
jgi:cell division septal protein FtsQ